MSKKGKRTTAVIIVALLVVIVILIVFVFYAKPAPQGNESESIVSSSSSAPPVTSSTAPVESYAEYQELILGTWVRSYDDLTEEEISQIKTNAMYEFEADGRILQYRWKIADADYPENWKVTAHEYTFDTYRGEVVLYETALSRDSYPKRFEFTTNDQGQTILILQEIVDEGLAIETVLVKQQ